jgi:hypothetical protein
MAMETKAILMGMAKYAAAVKSRLMYEYAASLASGEGMKMQSYEEAKAEEERVQAEDRA